MTINTPIRTLSQLQSLVNADEVIIVDTPSHLTPQSFRNKHTTVAHHWGFPIHKEVDARLGWLLGQTPLEYVTEWRMQKVMQLLQQRDK